MPGVTKKIDASQSEARDWQSLLADGSVSHLHLTVSDINHAFERSGNAAAAANPQAGNADDTFIDLYAALVSVPTIGKSLWAKPATTSLRAPLSQGSRPSSSRATGCIPSRVPAT